MLMVCLCLLDIDGATEQNTHYVEVYTKQDVCATPCIDIGVGYFLYIYI